MSQRDQNAIEGSKEKKISENNYVIEISESQRQEWQLQRWKKDKVENLLQKDGFVLKSAGRTGTIYFIQNNALCEIEFEIAGVKEIDYIFYFDALAFWQLPNKRSMTSKEKLEIKDKLLIWLQKKKIKAEL